MAAPLPWLLFVSLLGSGVRDWPGWRGGDGSGVGRGSPPLEWSETKNVRWKAPLPGRGVSSPIVWGERVFVTCALATGKTRARPAESGAAGPPAPLEEQECLVVALERASGRELWRAAVARAMPHQVPHPDASYAAATPVTDGERVYASFGSMGVFALGLDGAPAWKVDLGDFEMRDGFGEASSPVLCGDLLVLNCDNEGESFLVALDRRSGAERWRTPRPGGSSWSTPLVVHSGDSTQIVVGGILTIAYDAASGRELWSHGDRGAGAGGISGPVALDELVVWTFGARRGGVVRALPAPAQAGEAPELLWQTAARVPGVPSMLAYEGKLYMLDDNSGILSALDAASGELEHGPERLQAVANVYASPVAAAGRLYFVDRAGTVEVLSALPELKTLAVNTLDDAFDASPALAGEELFLRGRAALYCLAETSPRAGR